MAASKDNSDNIFQYNKTKHDSQVAQAPWKKDVHFYKRAHISALALVKIVMHARQGGNLEVMGCLQGKVEGDTIIVIDVFALPVEAVETRVNAADNAGPWMLEYLELQRQVGREENVIGWYHSHPGFGCWLSGIDVQTQSIHQQYEDPWLAIVVDPKRTMSSGKVVLGAYRTYPPDYTPPNEAPSEYQPIPMDKIEDFGVHCKRYYALEVTYFKSTLDHHLLNLLWDKYWLNTLSSSPLIVNEEYSSGQMSDLAGKLEKVESQLSQGKISSGVSAATASGDKKKEESLLSKITKDSNKASIEQVHGIMNEVLKDLLFNFKAK